jgi:hypothetical protein
MRQQPLTAARRVLARTRLPLLAVAATVAIAAAVTWIALPGARIGLAAGPDRAISVAASDPRPAAKPSRRVAARVRAAAGRRSDHPRRAASGAKRRSDTVRTAPNRRSHTTPPASVPGGSDGSPSPQSPPGVPSAAGDGGRASASPPPAPPPPPPPAGLLPPVEVPAVDVPQVPSAPVPTPTVPTVQTPTLPTLP